MRIAMYFVFCLVSNIALAQYSNPNTSLPTPESHFNCEELTSHVQTVKESARSKKEKFSCILNLLKSALSEELENTKLQETEENKDSRTSRNVAEEKEKENHRLMPERETRPDVNTIGVERDLFNDFLLKTTQAKMKNSTQSLEIPTMIPIFKPRPVVKTELKQNSVDSNPSKHNTRSNPTHEPHNLNLKSTPKFTIPCHRAADVLDMSNVVIPKEIGRNVQPIMKPRAPVTSPNIANQTPVSVHCTDLDDTVSMLFKPKAISLMQVYGNLLKKVTVTVLVPYHISKLGQQ